MHRSWLLLLALAVAAPSLARAQDDDKKSENDESRATTRGKDLKETVKDSEKQLLDEVDRLKKAIGVEGEKKLQEALGGGAKAEPAPGEKKLAEAWQTCGDPSCEKCRNHEFCRRRAEKVQQACERVLGKKKELEERFVQLRLDYRKLTAFLATESEKLTKDAESPPDSEGLSPDELASLKRSYLEMASHVRDLKPAYEERFKAIEKNEQAALAQLAILGSKASILKDALEVLRATDDLSELKKEIATLEENLTEMSSAIDKALAAFGDLAKTIRVEK